MADLALNPLFGDQYRGRRVLVTGHTGFKGSWLALWLHMLGAEVFGLALSPHTTPNHAQALNLPITQHLLDLRQPEPVRAALEAIQPEVIFHLAAQALVRSSYHDPITTFGSNVMGLVHLLDALRASPATRVVINATTDKCYAPNHPGSGRDSAYTENDQLGGHDPYSTSKACAELITACWRASFYSGAAPAVQIALSTARAGNVLGGGDWAPDRLVPDLIRAAHAQRPCVLRHPAAIRPWQHVLEPLSGYLLLGQRFLMADGLPPGSWNFGPAHADHATVADIADHISQFWPGMTWTEDRGPHPHEAVQLRLDCRHAERTLQWRPVWSVHQALEYTVRWYRDWYATQTLNSASDLICYIADARRQGLVWTT
jgi:CDP-glucose 4,6-dehydratase